MVRADQGERRVGRLRHITAAAPVEKDCKSFLPCAAIVGRGFGVLRQHIDARARTFLRRKPRRGMSGAEQPLRTIQNDSGQPIGLAGHSVAG
jgi:hypothetical protein